MLSYRRGGRTLAERFRRGPMPVDQSLDVARKIAEALEEAHEKGTFTVTSSPPT